MILRPRLLSLLLRHLFGRPQSRYAPTSASGSVPDGHALSARAFDSPLSAYPKRPQWAARAAQMTAWSVGFASAVAYLIWFFKHLFFNTIR